MLPEEIEKIKHHIIELGIEHRDLDDAIARAQEVVAARPGLAAAQYVLGSLYLRRGSLPQAVEALSAAARLAPNNGVTHLTLASGYERAGNVDKALAAYKRTQALLPNDPRPYNNAAWLYAVQGKKLDEALALARKAHEITRSAPALASGLPGVLDTLGFVH